MATKKRTSKTKRKNNKPSAAEVQKVEEFRLEILLWALIACSLLLFVSNFGIGGTIGNYVSSFLFGIFGLTAYVFPILLIIACFFMISINRIFMYVYFAYFYIIYSERSDTYDSNGVVYIFL